MKLDTMPHAGAATRVGGSAAAATTAAKRGGTSGFTRARRAAAGLVLASLAAAAPARAADLIVLYNFTSTTTGAGAMNLNRPTSGLTIDASGNLYGTASYNGGAVNGGVFRLARQADGSYAAPTALATFAGGSGPRNPLSNPVTVDAQGNLYGTTYNGGTSNVGTVYEVAAGTGTATTLATFAYSTTTGSAGYYPRGAEVRAGDGTLWGTTQSGGGGSAGTVYKVMPGATQATVVATFGQNGLSGANPYSGLVADAQGNLYGSTFNTSSGVTAGGTLFKVDTTAGTVTTLATFAGGTGGANPFSTLTVDGQGNLFGTTIGGGTSNYGTVFELAAGSSTITTLASFDGSTTGSQGRGVIVDAAGNLFGTTFSGNGSANGGAVWELAAGSGTLTTLASFAGSGTGPRTQYGGLVADASGNLYGTTYNGGTNGVGTVFKLANTGYVAAVAAVPEPASWAMMIVGIGAIGGALRRRQKVTARVSYAA